MNLPALYDEGRRRLALLGEALSVRRNGHAKAFRHPSGSTEWEWWPTSGVVGDSADRIDYATTVGDGLASSVVSAALCWLMRTFPEAPTALQRLEGEQWRTIKRSTPYVRLLTQPNPFYEGRILWMATIVDLAFGEAYWLKRRNSIGDVIELWWTPRALMTPIAPADGSEFISHYDYRPGGELFHVDPRNVVHFRFGLDPHNIRRGFSPLAAVMREIYTDEQACNFTAAILRNLGIIGCVISPKEKGPRLDSAAVKEVRDYIRTNFTGTRRGETLALGSPIDVQLLQYNLQGFDVGPIRDIAEERVCAALGIPAAVIGFGTGLQQTKLGATMREMSRLAWSQCLAPLQKIAASELDRALLPDFYSEVDGFRTLFDMSEVRAVWEDETDKASRMSQLFTSGVLRRSEVRAEIGYSTEPADDLFVLPTNVAAEGAPTPEPAPAPPPGDGGQAGG